MLREKLILHISVRIKPTRSCHHYTMDVAMIFSLVAIFGGFLLIITAIDEKQPLHHVGYTFCFLFALVPLVYITVKFCLFVKSVFVKSVH